MNNEALTNRRLLLSVLALMFILPSLIFLLPKDERKSACGSVEWEFQESFECLANPNMWKRWSEISQAYGGVPEKSRGEVGCPIFIQKIEKYNLSSKDKALFIELAETNGDIGIKYKFKEAMKKDFCDAAEENGWVDAYLKSVLH
jgi:hypothetical protein